MKFLVDRPLLGLAKWLRFLGFDAQSAAFSAAPPKGLPEPSSGTYLLTLQAPLKKLGRPDLIVLAGAGPEEQLREVLELLKLSRRDLNPLSRCGRCNEVLKPVARGAAQGRVPDHVLLTQKDFYECPGCRRLYWPGSHLPGIGRTLSRVLRRGGRGPAPKPPRKAEKE